MSATDQTQAAHTDLEHPSDRTYVKVAAFLAVITGIEVALSYIEMDKWILILSLVVLSIIKFVVVVGWFMHLKFDHPTLRKPFALGLILAFSVYTIVLANLIWHSGGGA